MKKAIVTGANGLVGRYLVDLLLKEEYEVYAIIRKNGKPLNIPTDRKNLKCIYCDLKDIEQLKNMISTQIELFFHLAWEGSSGDKRKDYTLQLQNALICVKACEIAKYFGCRKIVVSGSVTELMSASYLQEDRTKPESVLNYPICKTTAHYLCKTRCIELGLELCWSHIANLYGVGDTTHNLVNTVIRQYRQGEIPYLTAGEQLADFIYVEDVAIALYYIGISGINLTTYYVGGNNIRPLKEFILEIRDEIDPRLESGLGTKEFFGKSLDFEAIDVDKLRRETGFQPKTDFKTGIKKLLDWIEE